MVIDAAAFADALAHRARSRPAAVTPQDVNGTQEAAHGSAELIRRIIAELPPNEIVILPTPLPQGEAVALRAALGEYVTVVDAQSAELHDLLSTMQP